jgi:hypothetical protein
MEISQETSLYRYIYLKKAKKCLFFSFFFYKIRKQEGIIGPAQGGEGKGGSGRGRE